jgi:molybdenum cofactor cytidylyltransferase
MVLAAGLSQRMEGPVPKQLLPLGGETVVARSVRVAEDSQLDRVVVVTGHRAGEVAASIAEGRAEVVENPDYGTGNMSSFRVGAAALADCDAVVMLLGDMPGVSAVMIGRLVDEWHRNHPWAAWSVYTDGPGHPLLFSAAALQQASQMQGAKGVWRFLESAPPGQVSAVEFPIPAPTDVNTREDYEQLLRRIGR